MDNNPSDLNESLWRLKSGASPDTLQSDDLLGRPDLELDVRLTKALAKMSDVPVASNFTARVLAQMDREESQAGRSRVTSSGWRWEWRLALPRFAVTAALLFLVGLSVRQYEMASHRTILAKNVAMVAASQPLPSMDALENLDAIQRMGQSTHADGELLADLQ